MLQLVENERIANGSKQKIIVSLGTKLSIPKEKRSKIARIVKDRLTGQQSQLGVPHENLPVTKTIA